MGDTNRSDDLVAAELQRLDRRYGPFPVIEKEWPLSPTWYDRTKRRTAAGAIGGAGLWLVDERGRVLLVRRDGEDRWEEPGGKHEPDESLEETAIRETREEVGLDAHITAVAQVHRITVTAAEDPAAPAIENVYVVFRGEFDGGSPIPREGEIATVRWWATHPDRLHYEELRAVPIPAAE